MEDDTVSGPPSASRRTVLAASGLAAAVGLLAADRASAQGQAPPSNPVAQTPNPVAQTRRWLRFLVSAKDVASGVNIAFCAVEYESLRRALALEKEIVLFIEAHRSILTLRAECDKPAETLDKILNGELLDLRPPVVAVQPFRVSDYIEWELMLPPRPPKQ